MEGENVEKDDKYFDLQKMQRYSLYCKKKRSSLKHGETKGGNETCWLIQNMFMIIWNFH